MYSAKTTSVKSRDDHVRASAGPIRTVGSALTGGAGADGAFLALAQLQGEDAVATWTQIAFISRFRGSNSPCDELHPSPISRAVAAISCSGCVCFRIEAAKTNMQIL